MRFLGSKCCGICFSSVWGQVNLQDFTYYCVQLLWKWEKGNLYGLFFILSKMYTVSELITPVNGLLTGFCTLSLCLLVILPFACSSPPHTSRLFSMFLMIWCDFLVLLNPLVVWREKSGRRFKMFCCNAFQFLKPLKILIFLGGLA